MEEFERDRLCCFITNGVNRCDGVKEEMTVKFSIYKQDNKANMMQVLLKSGLVMLVFYKMLINKMRAVVVDCNFIVVEVNKKSLICNSLRSY